MIEFTYDFSGMRAHLAALPFKIDVLLDAAAESIVTDIKLEFDTGPDGLEYDRGSRGVHIASQPGYPPNIDTGALTNSMHWERSGIREREIMDGVEYGIYLEDGTEWIAPRPFMGPVFDEWGPGGEFERFAAEMPFE